MISKSWLEDQLHKKNTVSHIAKTLGVSKPTVYKYINQYKIDFGRNKRLKESEDILSNRDKIIEMYVQEKMSIESISKKLKTSPQRVTKFLKKNNIEINQSKTHPKLTKEWLIEKIDKLYNKKEMAEELGVSPTNIANHMKKYNLKVKAKNIQIPKTTRQKLADKKWLEEKYKNQTPREISKELGCSYTLVQNALHKFEIPILSRPNSSEEREIASFFPEANIVFNSRNLIPNSNIEADLYFPSSHFVVEHDGAYWHSTKFKNKNYHQQKKLKFLEHNIDMISIWDFEWRNPLKKDILLSMISNKLHENITKIRASKCEIKQIIHLSAKNFLDENHIQGFSACSIRYGLYHNNDLVAVMTFAKPRFNKKYDYEMIRFCVKKYTRVYGAASKLFNEFKKDYSGSSVISYCDLRYGNGRMYEKLGFEQTHISTPNYVWSNSNGSVVYKRYETQKHKLQKILGENFDINISEKRNMENNGFIQLFDCGNLVYVYIP